MSSLKKQNKCYDPELTEIFSIRQVILDPGVVIDQIRIAFEIKCENDLSHLSLKIVDVEDDSSSGPFEIPARELPIEILNGYVTLPITKLRQVYDLGQLQYGFQLSEVQKILKAIKDFVMGIVMDQIILYIDRQTNAFSFTLKLKDWNAQLSIEDDKLKKTLTKGW